MPNKSIERDWEKRGTFFLRIFYRKNALFYEFPACFSQPLMLGVMRFNNSKIQKLSILIIFIAASFVLLLLYQRYFTCIGVFVFLIAVCRFWYLELIEELIIACLKKAGGKKDVNSILSEFQKQGESALSRLSGKNIVEIENNIVRLIDVNRPNPFGK